MTRRHDIDALRALAFGLLILYHLGMLYVFDWGWHVKSTYQSEWLQWPMIFLNRWRMDLIFLISGIAAAYMLKRGEALKFLRQRNKRLLLPLLFGMAVIVPIQPYAQGVSNGLVQPGFLHFLADYYRHKTWPEGAFDGWKQGVTWNHLWYLAYLWVYTAVLAGLAGLLETPLARRLRAAGTGLRGAALLVLPALPFCLFTLTLQSRFSDSFDFVNDWYRNAMYFTAFFYGFCIARAPGFWLEAMRLRWISLVCALCLFAGYYALAANLPDDIPYWQQASIWLLRNFYLWTVLLAILGWAHALLNKPFRWLPWANESVYPWYILHQSLIVGLAFWLIPYRLGPVLEPLLVLIGTVVGCYLISELVKRVGWLRPCFGLKARTRNHALPAPAAGNRDMLFADTH